MANCVNTSSPQFQELRDTYFEGKDDLATRCILSFWDKSGGTAFPKEAYIARWIEKEAARVFNVDDIVIHHASESDYRLDENKDDPVGGSENDYKKAHILDRGRAPLNITRESLGELKKKLHWEGKNENSISVTRQFDPFADSDGFKNTQVTANGSIIHGILEHATKHIIEEVGRGGEPTFDSIRRALDSAELTLRTKNDGNFNINFGDGAKEKTLDSIAKFFSDVIQSGQYEFMDAEMRVKYDNPKDGREYRGTIDLLLKDKATGGLIVVDYKTSADPKMAKANAWTKKSNFVNMGGESKMDKLQLQATSYEMMLNHYLGDGAVVGKVLVPFTLETDKSGFVTGTTPTKISGQRELFNGGYLIPDTPEYAQRLKNLYGINPDANIETAAGVNAKLTNVIKTLQNEHTKLRRTAGDTGVARTLTFSFNEMGLQGDWHAVLSKTSKFLRDTLSESLANSNDVSFVNSSLNVVESVRRAFHDVSYDDFATAVDEYATNVLFLEGAPLEHFRNENLNAFKMLEDAAAKTSYQLEKTRAVLANKEVEDMTEMIKTMHKDFLPKYIKQAQADLKSAKITPEVMKLARELMDRSSEYANIERIKTNLLSGNRQEVNAMLRSQKTSFIHKIPIAKNLLSVSSSNEPLVQWVVHRLSDAVVKCTNYKYEVNNTIKKIADGLEKHFGSSEPREMYGFMLNEVKDENGKVIDHKIVRVANEEFYKEYKKYVDDGGSSSKWFNEHTVYKDFTKDTNYAKKLTTNFEILKNKGLDVPEVGDKLTSEDYVTLTAKQRVLELVEDLMQANNLSKEEAVNLSKYISGSKNLSEINDNIKVIHGAGGVRSEKNYVVDLLHECLGRADMSMRIPKSAEHIDPKYTEIMSYKDGDARKEMFTKWWDIANAYDDLAPRSKKLDNSMASVYLAKREGKHWYDPRSNAPDADQKAKFRAFQSTRHQAAEDGMYYKTVPLRYSGREVPLDQRSFDLCRQMYLLETSAHDYRVFGGAENSIRLVTDTYEANSASSTSAQPSAKKAVKTVSEDIAKIMDSVVYHTPQMQNIVTRLVNTLGTLDAFLKLALSPKSILRSHYQTVLDTQFGIYGKEEGFSRSAWRHASMEYVTSLGGLRQKEDVVDAFLTQYGMKEHYKHALHFEEGRGGIMNTLMKGYLISDNFHKRMLTSTHFYDELMSTENGEVIRLRDNLKINSEGKLELKNKNVYRIDGSGQYYDLNIAREKLASVFNRTIQSVDVLHQPRVTYSEYMKFFTMYRKLSYSAFEDTFKPTNYNMSSKQVSTGSGAALMLGVLNMLDNFHNGHTLKEKLGMEYFEGIKSFTPEEMTAFRRGAIKTAMGTALHLMGLAGWLDSDKEDGFFMKTLKGAANVASYTLETIGSFKQLYDTYKLGSAHFVQAETGMLRAALFPDPSWSDETIAKRIMGGLPLIRDIGPLLMSGASY